MVHPRDINAHPGHGGSYRLETLRQPAEFSTVIKRQPSRRPVFLPIARSKH